MKDWYLTKESDRDLNHRGKKVEPKSLIRLTQSQAAAHGDAVVKAMPPKSILDCAFPFEFEEWRYENQQTPKAQGPVTEAEEE